MLNEVLRLTQGNPSPKQQKSDKAPIYECQYVLIFNYTIITETIEHLTDEEAKTLRGHNGKWYKIPETQRERRNNRTNEALLNGVKSIKELKIDNSWKNFRNFQLSVVSAIHKKNKGRNEAVACLNYASFCNTQKERRSDR